MLKQDDSTGSSDRAFYESFGHTLADLLESEEVSEDVKTYIEDQLQELGMAAQVFAFAEPDMVRVFVPMVFAQMNETSQALAFTSRQLITAGIKSVIGDDDEYEKMMSIADARRRERQRQQEPNNPPTPGHVPTPYQAQALVNKLSDLFVGNKAQTAAFLMLIRGIADPDGDPDRFNAARAALHTGFNFVDAFDRSLDVWLEDEGAGLMEVEQ
jgi:hypothetical protein